MALRQTLEETEWIASRWRRRESLFNRDSFAGMEYDTDLVSSQGVAVTLFARESATRSEIARAKRDARNKRDVVCFYVERVPDSWYEEH